ncbi:MAG: PD-(D/E)XK nuclease family protein [Clostridia bacterium]|nr:PD-(D/E)XK nuclease family protein [Clostridia bacterium]
MLTVILAGVGDGKTTEIIKRIGALMDKGKHCVLIVPDQVTYSAERDICNILKRDGFSLCSVLSFNRFCQRVARSAGVKCPTRLSDAGRLMLLENAIDICRERLSVYRSSCKKSGFAQRMERMLSLLKSCRVSPEGLEVMLNTMPDTLLKKKLEDTAVIYRAYQELTGKDYCDNNDLFALAANNLDCDMLSCCHIFIDGFDTLTAQMVWLIEKLLSRCDVTVTLSLDESAPWLYSSQLRTLSALEEAASRHGGSMRTQRLEKRRRGNAFDALRDIYSVSPEESDAPCGGIDIYVAPDTEQEIRHIACDIRSKIEKGARYRDFGIACADPSLISDVERIFSAYGMSVFCDTARPMPAQPAVQLLLSALQTCRDRHGDSISDLLSNYLCPVERNASEALRGYIRSLGLNNHEVLNGTDRVSEKTRLELMELTKPLEPLRELKNNLDACSSAKDFTQAILAFIEGTELIKRVEDMIQKCIDASLLTEADEYKQVWDNIVAQLEQLDMLMSSSENDVDLYISMLRRGFEGQSCFVLPTTVDCIVAGDPARTRFSRIRELYVVGCVDGCFPPDSSNEGLLSPSELQRVNRDKKVLTPDTEDSSVRSTFELYSMLFAPEALHLSYAQKKGRGAQRPGRMLKRILEHCRVDTVEADERSEMAMSLQGAAELVASCEESGNEDIAVLRQALEQMGYHCDRLRFEHDSPSDAGALYGSIPISMSRLETQAECPLKNLLTGGLRLKEMTDYQGNSIDIGNIMHQTLECSVPELMALRAEDVEKSISAVVTKNLYAAAQSTHDGVMMHTARARLLCARLNKSVESACGDIMRDIGGFRPIAFEVSFPSRENPPITVDTPRGRVELQGKIDRVDASADGALRIVDYKSSDHSMTDESVQRGTTLQLPLYMLAMEQATGKEGVAMYYRNCFATSGAYKGISCEHPLTDPKRSVSREDFRRLLDSSKQTAARLAAQMLSGSSDCCNKELRFTRNSPCTYCPHQRTCKGRISKD